MSILDPILSFLSNPQFLSIIIAVIIFGIGYFVAIVIRRVVFKIGVRFYARNIARIVSKIAYYVILLIALSTALGYLGIELTGLIIAGGFAGIIKETVDNHPYVLAEPAPDIFVSKLGDSGVVITVRVWVPRTLVYPVMKDLLWKIKKSLDEAGISIPFPQLDVWIKTPVTLKREEGSG